MIEEKLNGLPNGWKWEKLGNVTFNFDGKRIPLSKDVRAKRKGEYKYYGATEVVDHIDDYIFDGQYILIGEDGANLLSKSKPLSFIVEGKFWVNNHAHVLQAKGAMELKYLNYYFNSLNLAQYITGSAQPKLTQNNLNKIPVPLPSIEEQQRIISRIEELFSELDKSIEDLKTALQQLKVYRQSVLKWAFEGRLTNEVKKGELPRGWKWVKFGDIHKIKSNLVSPEDFQDSPHIAPDNISKGTARLLNYGTIREDKVFSPKHRFFKGQIIYSKIRPNLAKVIIAPFDGLCSADMYPIESSLDNKFTLYFMLSKFFVDKASNTESRTVLPKINQKGLNEICFPLCTLDEQKMIIQEVESRLSVADKLEETILNSLEEAEALRQSILKKAFEGKFIK